MAGLKQTIIRGGLESLYFTGAHLALKPLVGGVGAILTLHHVRPPRPDRFQPNRLLEDHAALSVRVVKLLRRSGVDVVSLDEMHRRMTEGDFGRRFVCLTFDDGYRDTLQHAYPILKDARHAVRGLRADQLSRPARRIVVARARSGNRPERTHRAGDRRQEPHLRLPHRRREARAVRRALLVAAPARPTEAEMRAIMRDLAACYQVDIAAFCKDLCMDWQEIAALAADPLVTIGAHTVNHPMLAKLPEKAVRSEMDLSRSVIEAALGARPAHLSYPYRRSAAPRAARIRDRSRTRFQDRGDDAAGRAVPPRTPGI